MRKLLWALALSALASPAFAQCPATFVAGAVLTAAQLNAAFACVTASAATNAALAASASTQFPNGVVRTDYAAGRNAGPLFFLPQTGTCAASGRVNDGGSCVDGTGGNSFRAVPPEAGLGFRQFGAVGDGTTDDTAAVQAAFTASGVTKAPLLIGEDERFGINSTGIICNTPVKVIGNTPGRTDAGPTTMPGFVPLQVNTTVLHILNGCSGSLFSDLTFDMSAPGTQTSTANAAILMGNSSGLLTPGRVRLDRVTVFRPCIGIDMAGNSNFVDNSAIRENHGTGCGGIRIGHFAEMIEPYVMRTHITSDATHANRADYGMLLQDSSGGHFAFNDIIHPTIGTIIRPGANQVVKYNTWTGTVVGDNVFDEALLIDTLAASAVVRANNFDDAWFAQAAGDASGSPLVTIKNFGAATDFSGFKFLSPKAYFSSGGGFDVLAGTYFSLIGGRVCGYGTGASDQVGVHIFTGVTNFHIQDNTIQPDCDGFNGNSSTSISMNATANDGIITGNTVDAAASGAPITFTVGATSKVMIKDNPGSFFEIDGGMSVACTGLNTGSCALAAGSSPQSFKVTLSPTGVPLATGDITITSAFGAAKANWVCTAGLQSGTAAWLATAFLRSPNAATDPIVRWDTGGAILTAGSTYGVVGSCKRI